VRQTGLELGPGINFGSALVLACHGVRPILAGRFLANWDANYHPKFYSALRKTLAEHDPAADLTLLDRLLGQNAYADDGIAALRAARRISAVSPIPRSTSLFPMPYSSICSTCRLPVRELGAFRSLLLGDSIKSTFATIAIFTGRSNFSFLATVSFVGYLQSDMVSAARSGDPPRRQSSSKRRVSR
jgi:hypothetical protein